MFSTRFSFRALALPVYATVIASSADALISPTPTPIATQRNVSFTWSASPSSSVLGYRIYWGTGSGNYQNVRDVKNVLKTTLSLPKATKYYVAVSAYNSGGNSGFSNQVIVPIASN